MLKIVPCQVARFIPQYVVFAHFYIHKALTYQ